MTENQNAAPQRPNLSAAGRRVRAGGFALRAEVECGAAQRDAALAVQNVARSLAQQLDSIRADAIRTPLEKRTAAAAAVAAARRQTAAIETKVAAAENDLRERIEHLEGVRRSYESKVSPFDVERLKLKAAAIREAGGDAIRKAWADARASRNADDAVMLSLVSPLNGGDAQRLFLELARPEQLGEVRRDIAVQRTITADAATFLAGINELERASDPHLGDEPNATDLFAQASNTGAPLSPTLPLWINDGGAV